MSRSFCTDGRISDAVGRRLRVLYLTNMLPFPVRGGGQLRESNLIARLSDSVDIDLLAITENFERDYAHVEMSTEYCTYVGIFETDARGDDSELPSGFPTRISRYVSDEFDAEIARLLEEVEYDLVHVEGYFIATHLPADLNVPLALVEENIEYKLDIEHDQPWETAREIEHRVWDKATIVGALTDDDLAIMRDDVPALNAALSPNGFDHVATTAPKVHTADGKDVVFVGNFAWKPTGDAGRYLVHQIWPLVLKEIPDANLRLVGAGLTAEFRSTGVELVGDAESVKPFLIGADLFASPTLTGSGIRVKIVEALSTGCAIVCTDAALRGLPEHSRDVVVVADDVRTFAAALIDLLKDPSARQRLSDRAFTFANDLPNWDEAAKMLLDIWQRAREVGESASTSVDSRTINVSSLTTSSKLG